MKQGTVFTRVAMLVLFLGMLGYLGFSAWNSLTDPFSTTLAYEYTSDDSVEVRGILVREELVLPGQSGIADLRFAEGEKVGVGQTVVNLYQTDEALERRRTLRALELEAEQLEYAMAQSDAGSNAKLDDTIIAQTAALRAAAARQDFTRLEGDVLELKSTVLKRDYTYGGHGPEALEQQLALVRTQLRDLRAQSTKDVSAVTAPASGTFSALVDGYEGLITPDTMTSLSPSALEELLDRKVTEDPSALGKLITATRWYFVTTLSEQDADRLTKGAQTTVRFSRDFSADLSMRVEFLSGEEDGQVTVIFSSTRALAQTTLLRRQTAEIIFESSSGLRVPKRAIHLTEESVTADDGTETARTVYGVYVLVGARAEFKPVEIVGESGEFYVVTSLASDKTALRPGNEIILSARGLYDGKVVR